MHAGKWPSTQPACRSPRLRVTGGDTCPVLCRYDTREGEDAPDAQSLLPLLRPFALPLEVRGRGGPDMRLGSFINSGFSAARM